MRTLQNSQAGRITRAGARAGFSLVELLIVMVRVAVLLTALGMVSLTGQNAYEQTTLLNNLDSRGARALSRVSEELATISGTQMNPVPTGNAGAEQINFVQAVGFAAGAPVWGPNTRIEAEYEPGEVDDGVDNDADGLVDERQLVLTRDFGGANPKRVVLVRGIAEWGAGEIANNNADDNANGVTDEQGFNLHMVGDVITLRLWLQAIDADNQLTVREIQNTVRLRNAGI